MRNFIFAATLCAALQGAAATPEWVDKAYDTAAAQSEIMYGRVEKEGKLPRSIARGMMGPEDWCTGFFPGTMWLLYAHTGDSIWQARARKGCEMIAGERFNAFDHDIGFKMQCSFGTGLALVPDKDYEQILYRSARTLASRFDPRVGLIQSWEADTARDWKFPVIIDNMMNLELLMEAYKRSGDSSLRDIAVAHADKTMRCHYRPNSTCPHVVDYDPLTGEVRKFDWNNGSDDVSVSTWGRGQSWGLYGFTMMFRETGDRRYLQHAERIADYLLGHPNLPADMVPYWDYTGADRSTMRDAAAAAVMASALMELSTWSANGERYFEAGERQLKSLASDEYLATPGTNEGFIIKHATGNYLWQSELDGSLSYADYYFMEALDRYLKLIEGRTLYNNSRMLHASSGNWFVEAHDPATTVTEHDGVIDITTPKGFTMWYDRPLSGNYRITYKAMLPEKGGAHDRASDLNCFCGAKDPDNPADLYAAAAWRKGIFQHYKSLKLFYVGYGGNYNTTTRFRKYHGGGPQLSDEVVRPVIAEYTDKAHLLKPNKWYSIEIEAKDGHTTYSMNGRKLFELDADRADTDGYFGLRLLSNHCLIRDFKIESI